MGKRTQSRNDQTPAADRAGGVAEVARKQGTRGPAPVHLWNPPYCGEMDLVIRRDGTWIHEGSPIGRPEMVRMFSNIMKYEDGRHYLVTPVEKIGIQVEDSPFIAVDVDIAEHEISFTTNIGDEVRLDADHPLTMAGTPQEPRPYIEIRDGLLARIDRKSFYRMAESVISGPGGQMGVSSAGMFFPLEPAPWQDSPPT